MWVLDVVSAASGAVENTFYLVAGEWSIGRKKCHFNFHADASISRTHALLRVGTLSLEQLRDASSRPSLVLVDQNSRFGSFVNQEQCFSERELKNGDHVSFGAKRTILRVRYQVFILVASRIQRANRARVNETCQQIGMHLIASESKDATHCIMDPGKIIATVKVLWALVYNQPVVCTPWIYAILARKSMSEPLPRCEEFLPTDEHMPSVAHNYLPNAMRKTLYHRHVVVFLSPQSMEDIIAAMAGVVIAAYRDSEHDELLLRDIEQHAASRHVLIVEPLQSSGYSSAVASSDGRELQSAGTGMMSSHAAVERRVTLFRSIGASFVTVQELAASVIFAKAPATASEYSFSSSIAGHHSSSVQICSFPEHLSLPAPASAVEHKHQDDGVDDDKSGGGGHDEVDRDRQTPAAETSRRVTDDDVRSETPVSDVVDPKRERVGGVAAAAAAVSVAVPPAPESLSRPSSFRGRALPTRVPKPFEPSAQVKAETQEGESKQMPVASDVRVKEEAPAPVLSTSSSTSLSDYPAAPVDASSLSSSNVLSLDPHSRPAQELSASVSSDGQSTGTGWVSTLSSQSQRRRRGQDDGADSADVKDMDMAVSSAADDARKDPKPVVVSCSLVVKRPVGGIGAANNRASSAGVNFKRFRKGNGLTDAAPLRSSSSSLASSRVPAFVPQQTVASVAVDNADRAALEASLEALEEQERIADELFAMAEHRTTKRRF